MPVVAQLDGFASGWLHGWAWDAPNPELKLLLGIELDGEPIGEVRAAAWRADLWEAGVGDGEHGFSFALPEFATDTDHRLVIRLLPAGTPLPVPDPFVAGLETAEPAAEDEPRSVVVSLHGALLGQDGWLFTLEPSLNALTLAGGGAAFDVSQAVERVLADARLFAAADVVYLPVLVPLRELVKRTRLPETLGSRALEGPGNVFRRRLAEDPELEVFDLTLVLADAEATGSVFARRDPLLTPYGAWQVARALVKRLGPDIDADASHLPQPLADAAPDPSEGELSRGPIYAMVDEDLVRVMKLPSVAPEDRTGAVARGGRYEIVPAELDDVCDAVIEAPYSTGRIAVRAAPVARRAAVHLGECFASTLLVRPDASAAALVDRGHPDVVVELLDERMLAG